MCYYATSAPYRSPQRGTYAIYAVTYTTQISFRSVLDPSVTTVFLTIFGKALSVNPRVSTSEVYFVLRGVSRIVNFHNWQLVGKLLIIHIRLFKNLLCYNTLLTKSVFFNFTWDSFKYSSDIKPRAYNKVCHAERQPLQIGLSWKQLLSSKLTLYFPEGERMAMRIFDGLW